MITHPVLQQLASSGVKLGVERVRRFLTYLGDPHLQYPVVHVGGTNGKGSVCAMVTSTLRTAGYRVGTYTSPHLEAVNERVCIDGVPIDNASLNEAIEALDRERWDWVRGQESSTTLLTYYEFMTILAFLHFARTQVDVAVVEVGMGGRLDATNVVRPLVTAITSVGLDHQQELGETVEVIAAEKAGILKGRVPVVLGALPTKARDVVERRAAILGCDVWRPGGGMTREFRKGLWSFRTPDATVSKIALRMKGQHQGNNALVATGILHQLRGIGLEMSDEHIAQGLATAFIPGRIEELVTGLVVDGAHNLESVTALAAWLSDQPRPERRILLWGMGQGRDPVAVIGPLLKHVDEVVTTRCAHPKACDPEQLAFTLQEHVDIELSEGGAIDEALAEVFCEANQTIVAGSLYLAGAARSLVRAGTLDGLQAGQGPLEEEPAHVDEEVSSSEGESAQQEETD